MPVLRVLFFNLIDSMVIQRLAKRVLSLERSSNSHFAMVSPMAGISSPERSEWRAFPAESGGGAGNTPSRWGSKGFIPAYTTEHPSSKTQVRQRFQPK